MWARRSPNVALSDVLSSRRAAALVELHPKEDDWESAPGRQLRLLSDRKWPERPSRIRPGWCRCEEPRYLVPSFDASVVLLGSCISYCKKSWTLLLKSFLITSCDKECVLQRLFFMTHSLHVILRAHKRLIVTRVYYVRHCVERFSFSFIRYCLK